MNRPVAVRKLILLLVPLFLCACGYSREEKRHMKDIAEQGRENAVIYIQEKYGFVPEVENITVCKVQDDGSYFPEADGTVLAVMRYGEEEFRVHISGEGPVSEGADDYQRGLIAEDGKAFFEALLGYGAYDFFLQYGEEGSTDCLISKRYEAGNFEDFMQKNRVTIRMDDCAGQDLTTLPRDNPEAAAFLEEYARNFGMRIVLISYRSSQDYQNGYTHTYGLGSLDYGIWQDGLYIRSYATCEGDEGICASCFELQEFDGMIFSCVDQAQGHDLFLAKGQVQWLDLEETRGDPLSEVYSVEREDSGEVTVYIPSESFSQYGRRAAVFIQHLYKEKWWQYDLSPEYTTDGKYLFITYHGIQGSNFDFAFFNN